MMEAVCSPLGSARKERGRPSEPAARRRSLLHCMRRSRPLAAGTGARRSTSAVTASALSTMAPGGVGGCRYGASTEIGQTFHADNKCHRTARGTCECIVGDSYNAGPKRRSAKLPDQDHRVAFIPAIRSHPQTRSPRNKIYFRSEFPAISIHYNPAHKPSPVNPTPWMLHL
jgi:hypothetical protein